MNLARRSAFGALAALMLLVPLASCQSSRDESTPITSLTPGPSEGSSSESTETQSSSPRNKEPGSQSGELRFDEDGDRIIGLPELGQAPEGTVWQPIEMPSNFTCDGMALSLGVFAEGLYLIEDTGDNLKRICAWSDDPEAYTSMVDGSSEATVLVRLIAEVQRGWTEEFVTSWCENYGELTQTSVELGAAGCAEGSLNNDHTFKSLTVTTPYAGVELTVSCAGMETCTPEQLPGDFTDSAGFEAISQLAASVREKLQFTEVDLRVGEVGDQISLVTNWAEAKFPAQVDEPGWYCLTWSGASDEVVAEIKETSELYDVTWDISEADLEAVIPEVYVNFQNAQIAYTVEVGKASDSYCILDVAERTY